MIVQRTLAYCDVESCLEATTIYGVLGKAKLIRELRTRGWAYSSDTQVRCPSHKHMHGRRNEAR